MSPVFRQVTLPDDLPGKLYLSAMPGRLQSLAGDIAAARELDIQRTVCLTPMEEITARSPEYAAALADGALPWDTTFFAIPDFGAPADQGGFRSLGFQVAGWLRSGVRVRIHCAGGIGRSGMLAICTLHVLGIPIEQASAAVRAAGSHLETLAQQEFVARLGSG